MSTVHGEFRERSAQPKIRSVPLSHLSVELGHLYMEDYLAGPARLEELFAEAAPWAEAAARTARAGRTKARVSTCFLVDDYFSDLHPPDEILPALTSAAERAGVTIDYLARESACASALGPAGKVSPAELLVSRLVTEPPAGTTGARPSPVESGWLSNGQRSPSVVDASAMDVGQAWTPPVQNAARRHSIFVDVELWDGKGANRVWSCPLLAAVWQLLRLRLMRHQGEPLVEPVPAPANLPASWADLPPVVRLNPRAAPFCAYGTTTILSPRFLPVELAVRTILGQVWHDPAVTQQLAERARGEGLALPAEVLDRITYAFAGSGEVDPA